MTGETSMGWPVVNLIGTPAAILRAFTKEGVGGWATGDAEEDAETAYLHMKDAKQIFG